MTCFNFIISKKQRPVIMTIYPSRFSRADSRTDESRPGCRIFTTRFANTVVVRDIFLSAGAVMQPGHSGHSCDLLFPIVGPVSVSGKNTGEQLLAPGTLFNNATDEITICNPLEDTVNLLQIGYNMPDGAPGDTHTLLAELHITEKNRIFHADAFAGHISVGIYDSRTKDKVRTTNPASSLFTYVINGSFEVEGRLMEYRDGLLQWQTEETELEALSETAILLIIECSSLKQ